MMFSKMVTRFLLKQQSLSNLRRGISHDCDQGIVPLEVLSGEKVQSRFRDVMGKVPQPVAVVTSAVQSDDKTGWLKRGMTCSSVTSISMKPPIFSFAIGKHSRMHDLLMKKERFAIHLLANNQAGYGIHFSKPPLDGLCQFKFVPHEQDEHGIPVIRDTMAVLFCQPHSIHTIGDHHVWYGEVLHAYQNSQVSDPLLYFRRKFRSLGDEAFIGQFEDQTLPFEDWSHTSHIRMTWHYIHEFGKNQATPLIKNGIRRYDEQHADNIRGYNETVTGFYIRIVASAMETSPQDSTFEEFIEHNPYILDQNLIYNYYSDEVVNSEEAAKRFVCPDKKEIAV